VILKWVVKKWGGCGLESSDSGYGPVAIRNGHANEPSGFINFGKVIDQLSDILVLKKKSEKAHLRQGRRYGDTGPRQISP
jgi:hypothetical protein